MPLIQVRGWWPVAGCGTARCMMALRGLVNTTVARNSVPAGATNRSAGIYAAGPLQLENVTIVDNLGAGLQITTMDVCG
jgi:hypothetical protein